MSSKATLYKCKVKDIPDYIFGQLARLNNGVDGRMLTVLLNHARADVYFWIQSKQVISWASVSNGKGWGWNTPKGTKEINLYTKRGYRRKGFARETIDYIKKDFPKQLKNGNLKGHGSCTTLIERTGLADME